MTRLGGGRKVWIFSITLSLLLHVPIIFLLLHTPLPKPAVTPGLKLSARPLPAKAQPAAGPPQAAQTRPTAAQTQKTEAVKAPSRPKQRLNNTRPETTTKSEKESVGTDSGNTLPTAPAGMGSDTGNGANGAREAAGQGGGSAGSGLAADSGPVDVYSLQITKKIIPDYPAFSRKRNESGTVKIIVTIKDGAVTKAGIKESSGYERLDNSALRAAKQWRFNHDKETQAIIPFIFNLND